MNQQPRAEKHQATSWLRWASGVFVALLVFGLGVFVWMGQSLPNTDNASADEERTLPATAWSAASGKVQAVPVLSNKKSIEGLLLNLGQEGSVFAMLDDLLIKQIKPDAARFLRVQVHQWPQEVRVYVMWQSTVNNKPQHGRALLPKTSSGDTIVDLSQHKAWRGSLNTLGLAVVPESMLSNRVVRGQTLRLANMQLLPDTRGHRLSAMWQTWWSPRMWVGKSINTQGFENNASGDHHQTLMAAWLFFSLMVGAWLAMGSLNRRVLFLALCVSWGGLMLLELHQQWLRVGVHDAQAQAAGASIDERLAAIPYLVDAANAVRQVHQKRGGAERIVVQAHANHNGLYLSYLLRPLDVAFERSQRALSHAPKEVHLLVTTDPKFDAWHQKLKSTGWKRNVHLLQRGDGWQIFEVEAVTP